MVSLCMPQLCLEWWEKWAYVKAEKAFDRFCRRVFLGRNNGKELSTWEGSTDGVNGKQWVVLVGCWVHERWELKMEPGISSPDELKWSWVHVYDIECSVLGSDMVWIETFLKGSCIVLMVHGRWCCLGKLWKLSEVVLSCWKWVPGMCLCSLLP